MKKWEQIYNELKIKIKNNFFKNNQYLPSENQLCITYNTSRETIRKIYAKLESENYIISIKNKGRMLKRDYISSTLKSFRDLTNNKFTSNYRIISNDEHKVTIEVKRYDTDGQLFIYVKTKLYKKYIEFDFLNENILSKYGILNFLKNYSINPINNAVKRFIFGNDNKDVLKILDSNSYILNDCLIFDNLGNIVEHSLNYYHPNYFEYYIYEKINNI